MSSFINGRRYKSRANRTHWASNSLAACLLLLSLGAGAAKDPTRPPGFATANLESAEAQRIFRLDSVIVGGQRRLAVINGQRFQEGDELDGARVLRIDNNGVLLRWQGQPMRIDISKPVFEKRARRDKN